MHFYPNSSNFSSLKGGKKKTFNKTQVKLFLNIMSVPFDYLSKVKKNVVFWNIFFRFRDIDIFSLCKLGSDDVINRLQQQSTESRISLE